MNFQNPAEKSKFFSDYIYPHYQTVRMKALSIIRDQADADDIAQETLEAAWKSLEQLRDPAKAEAWLFSIARNSAMTAYRKKLKEAYILNYQALPQASAEVPAYSDQNNTELFAEAFSTLTMKQKMHIYLRYFCGLPAAEICFIMDIDEHTRSSGLSRARARLRKKYAELLKSQNDMI